MRLTVKGLRSFLVRNFRKAEDLTSVLVEPIPVVLNPVVVLDLHVLPVEVGHRLCGQPFGGPVMVHE